MAAIPFSLLKVSQLCYIMYCQFYGGEPNLLYGECLDKIFFEEKKKLGQKDQVVYPLIRFTWHV